MIPFQWLSDGLLLSSWVGNDCSKGWETGGSDPKEERSFLSEMLPRISDTHRTSFLNYLDSNVP